jgi:uncharacterized protein
MSSLVIDYAWAHPDPAAIRAAGYIGVMRYVSHDPSKSITAPEATALHAQQLGFGIVFEDNAQRALSGFAGGVEDGKFANAAADAIGFPKDLPIMYAVDFAVTAAQLPTVLAYLQGAATTGRQAHGYGSLALTEYLEANGIPDDWQTCAWSNNQVDPKAALYQRLTPTTALKGSYDENVVLHPSNILWFPDGAAVPASVPTSATPGKKDLDMLIIKGQTDAEYLILGDGSVHIPTPPDVELLKAAGIGTALGLSQALVDSIVGLDKAAA